MFRAISIYLAIICAAAVAAYMVLMAITGIVGWLSHSLYSIWSISMLVVILFGFLTLFGFALYRKWKNSPKGTYGLHFYFVSSTLFILFLILEAWCYNLNYKPGFDAAYSFLEYQEKFELTEQYRADSHGITRANPAYFALHKPEVPINSEGFRGREFTDSCMGTKKRLLLLGDSFVWGLSADPINNSFADLLEERYCVYNTGIIGADPAQYLAIAKLYIPRLKPDAICLFLFQGNDFIGYNRVPQPQVPIFYWSHHMGVSSTYFLGCDSVLHFGTADSAYNFIMDRYSLLKKDNWFLSLLAKTNLGTQAYFLLYQPQNEACPNYRPRAIVRPIVEQIQQLANENSSQLIIFLIPDKNRIPNSLEELHAVTNNELLDLDFKFPQNIQAHHYAVGGDGHFNNEGHRTFAKFVEDILSKELAD